MFCFLPVQVHAFLHLSPASKGLLPKPGLLLDSGSVRDWTGGRINICWFAPASYLFGECQAEPLAIGLGQAEAGRTAAQTALMQEGHTVAESLRLVQVVGCEDDCPTCVPTQQASEPAPRSSRGGGGHGDDLKTIANFHIGKN